MNAPEKPLTLTQIAERIRVHLKRMEDDPKINKNLNLDGSGTSLFYLTNCWRGGQYVCVQYIRHQGWSSLNREQALEYLAALDAGRNIKHYSLDRRRLNIRGERA